MLRCFRGFLACFAHFILPLLLCCLGGSNMHSRNSSAFLCLYNITFCYTVLHVYFGRHGRNHTHELCYIADIPFSDSYDNHGSILTGDTLQRLLARQNGQQPKTTWHFAHARSRGSRLLCMHASLLASHAPLSRCGIYPLGHKKQSRGIIISKVSWPA